MSYKSPELVNEIKKIDLLTYLKVCEPNELVHISGEYYGTKTYSSLKIDHGLWHYCKQHVGGKNAVDFLMKMKNMAFIDAINLIQKNMGIPDKEMTKEEYLEWKNSHSILKNIPQYYP